MDDQQFSQVNRDDFDRACMEQALLLARLAEQKGEVPVGAVLTSQYKIVSQGHNQPIALNDPTAHAEIIAIRQAGQLLQNYRLVNTTLYVTLEPCTMCVGAMLHARIGRLVFAASDPKTGACGGRFHLLEDGLHHHRIQVESGLYEDQAKALLQNFFKQRRIKSG